MVSPPRSWSTLLRRSPRSCRRDDSPAAARRPFIDTSSPRPSVAPADGSVSPTGGILTQVAPGKEGQIVRGSGTGLGRRLLLLALQQGALAPQAPAVAAQVAVLAHHAGARDAA